MRPAAIVKAILLLSLLTVSQLAVADGILIPPLKPIDEAPYFSIKYHHVKVNIEDEIATTYIDQVFKNETNREQEATYIFPLPPGAVVKDFTLIVDGKEMPGEILEREKAVKIYEEIVRSRRDPALLEYTGRNMYKARIYPIPARGERRVEIRYSELLPYDNGLVGYNYPMSTEKFSSQPIKQTIFEATIESKRPLGTIYSPSHEIDVSRKGKHKVTVSYEETNTKPDRDMLLYYSTVQDEVSSSVLTFKEKGKDGFFLLLTAPAPDDEKTKQAAPKNVIFVLDRSGSMSGEKIEQARKALRFCVNSLNPQDSFEIFTFSSAVSSFGEGLVKASKENIEKARAFIDDIRSRGGTAMDEALQVAIEARRTGQPNYLAVLTDGLPTVGDITDPDEIAARAGKAVASDKDISTRVFTFGVGYDVDTHFLDKVADENGGLPTYVRPSEDIEVKVSNWYAKIAQPVLTDVAFDFGDVKTYDTYPKELPDLFSGSRLALFGRYKADSAGATTITLTGSAGKDKKTFRDEVNFPEARAGTDYIASLWASRKIGYLLDQIRLHGKKKELVDEVVALSSEYGILTEYTAFLADEDVVIARSAAPEAAGVAMDKAFEVRGGGWATSQTQNAQRMRGALNVAAQNKYLNAEGEEGVVTANVQNRGARGFVGRKGQLQDMRYDPQVHKVTLQVQAFSEAYFQISRAFPQANQFMALSDNMIVLVNGNAVQIGPEGKTTLTQVEIEALQIAPQAPNPDTTGAAPVGRESSRTAGLGRGAGLAAILVAGLALATLPRRRRS